MRVGVVKSSRTFIQNLKKNIVLIFVMSFLYAVNSFALSYKPLAVETLKPFIFIPALASIIFGPLVGCFSAGIGSLLTDFIQVRLIEGLFIDLSHFAGFLGNALGAAMVGFLSQRLKLDKDDRVLFSGKTWLRYLQNTLAAMLGMGLITGETTGLFTFIFRVDDISWHDANALGAEIFYYNTLFLLVTILPLQLVIGFYEKIRARRYANKLHNSKNVTLLEEPDSPPALIEKFEIIPGPGIDGLVKGEWSQIKMLIRNNTKIPMTFRLEINCEDRVNPSVTYTKLLQPQETDEKFFQINPFNDAERVFKVYIKSWSPTFKELTTVSAIGISVRYRYTYNTLTPFEHQFNYFLKFLSLSSFGVFIYNTIYTIYKGSGVELRSNYFIAAAIICGVELIVLLVLSAIKFLRAKRKIAKIKERADEDQVIAQEKLEREQQYYQQELMKLEEQYDLTVDKEDLPTTTLTYEDVQEDQDVQEIHQPIIDEQVVQEEPEPTEQIDELDQPTAEIYEEDFTITEEITEDQQESDFSENELEIITDDEPESMYDYESDDEEEEYENES
jgi:hypothetical protein